MDTMVRSPLGGCFLTGFPERPNETPIHLTGPDVNGSSPVRLLIYSQDGLGLGHMRRTNEIAGELLRRRPGSAVLTLQDSPLGNFFQTQPGHDYVKLPSVHKLAPGAWEPINLPLAFEEVRAMRRDILASAVTGFRPDLVLVDHMPHGAMGELTPALDSLRRIRKELTDQGLDAGAHTIAYHLSRRHGDRAIPSVATIGGSFVAGGS